MVGELSSFCVAVEKNLGKRILFTREDGGNRFNAFDSAGWHEHKFSTGLQLSRTD